MRYTARTLAKTPGFTAVAVIALALGIGADTGIFTIANGAFSWNMGLNHPDRAVLVTLADASRRQEFGASYQEFQDLRAATKSLMDLAAYPVCPSEFKRQSRNPATVLVREVVGQRVYRFRATASHWAHVQRVNDVPTTVIGVSPPGKRVPEDTDLWVPLIEDALTARKMNSAGTLFGRLHDGVSMDVAPGDLSHLAERLAEQDPDANQGVNAKVQTIAQLTDVYNARPLFVALWFAGFVLLIACADVANMLLAIAGGFFGWLAALGYEQASVAETIAGWNGLLVYDGRFRNHWHPVWACASAALVTH